ncbi:uncharacterized protein LOC141905115 [Tubulanus polymorphus]|uniref:uncharacterized protein LOC141905115 n=1 Tax=Tubulanus polymorphus TaxID=672921 RepID=UPI003DA3D846
MATKSRAKRKSRDSLIQNSTEDSDVISGTRNEGLVSSASSLISVQEAEENNKTDNAPKNAEKLSKEGANEAEKRESQLRKQQQRNVTESVELSETPNTSKTIMDGERSKPSTPIGSKIDLLSGLRKNVVHPAPVGSSVSLKSDANSKSDLRSLFSTRSETESTLIPRGGDQHAYVPYLYAKKCVITILDDMQNMKTKHVEIIRDIEGNFRTIEKESQNQFNQFILSLRQQYGKKVTTFRQVIEAHRTELLRKEHYWDEALISLSMRNKTLLEEKRRLLLYIQSLTARALIEKQEAVNSLTSDIDDKTQQLNNVTQSLKERDEELLAKKTEIENFTRDKKILQGELDAEKSEVARLKSELNEALNAVTANKVEVVSTTAAVPVPADVVITASDEVDTGAAAPAAPALPVDTGAAAPASVDTGEIIKPVELVPIPAVAPTVVKVIDNHQIDELTQRLEDLESDHEQLSEEKNRIQQDLNNANMLIATLETKNEVLSERVSDFQTLQAQVTVLTAAAAIVDQEKADEKLKKVENDKALMKEELENIDKDLDKWESEFKDREGRMPTENDRSEGIQEIYTQKYEVAGMVENLNKQVETLEQLKSGQIPEAPKPEIAAPEIQVKTVEVLVPDPVVYEKLIKAKEKLSSQRKEISNLKNELEVARKSAPIADSVVAPLVNPPISTASSDNTSQEARVDDNRIIELESLLAEEQAAHAATLEELEILKAQQDQETVADSEEVIGVVEKNHQQEMKTKEKEIENLKNEITQLEDERHKSLPASAIAEVKKLRERVSKVEKEKAAVSASKNALINSEAQMQMRVKGLERLLEKQKKDAAAAPKVGKDSGAGKDQSAGLKRENTELKDQIRQLEAQLKRASAPGAGAGGMDLKQQKKQEKVLKELEKKYELEKKKAERNDDNFKKRDEEFVNLKKEFDDIQNKLMKLTTEMAALGEAAQAGQDAAVRLKEIESEAKKLRQENNELVENYNSERVLRKKYYNMVEDMKGKIRVYCRARPLSKSETGRGNVAIIKSPDEYTININSNRGLKEFQFDQIFMPESSQEKVFEDTNNLIQSAVDGYNVCIFAYGQTGSGKTFTMIGDREGNFPGIAPRAFNRIYDLIEENKSKFTFSVSVYMMELYNDKLLDLFSKSGAHDDRMDIKKDKKGLVFVQGAEVKIAANAKELNFIFEEGSKNRHVASTKMNAESSRSHLIIGIIIESTNKSTGAVLRGKLSLVDLAGSERVAKTEASPEQLKEANSINKSLSALGDVISALSSEQSFIPYRNNKLTMLMQDSLGGNAKTLMFVNISPADYNADETVISLTYASRVKLITNDASKNADNKEIARLKGIIDKMKKGESVDEEL